MMDGRSAFLRVGLLIVLTSAALVGLVLFLSGNRLRHGIAFESYFSETVQGLNEGAPVKFRGVTLGQVTDIGLVSAEYDSQQKDQGAAPKNRAEEDGQRAPYRLILVRYLLDPKKMGHLAGSEAAIRNGLRARIAAQGLSGLAYIELDFVDPARFPPLAVPWRPEATYLPSVPSTLSQVQEAGQQVLAKLNQLDIEGLFASVNGLIGDLRENLKSGDVHTAMSGLAELLRVVQTNVQQADLPGLSADLRGTAGSVRSLAEDRQLRVLLTNAATAAEKLAAAAGKLPALIAALDATARRTDNSTADIQAALAPLLRDTQAAAANLRDTTDALRQYPAQVLLGGPPPRPGGVNQGNARP